MSFRMPIYVELDACSAEDDNEPSLEKGGRDLSCECGYMRSLMVYQWY